MERKDFIKKSAGFLGLALAVPSWIKAGGLEQETETMSCTVTNSETAGPFPTITPSSYVRSNIISDNRTGVPFTINITIQNSNAACAAYAGALVDIWHCDKDGYYSEYGGTAMQTVDYTSVHFLRGRQVADASGLVSFTSIFPGWYMSRATHIHVHIYKPDGTSLLVTQIAFPEGTNSAVNQVNAATSYGYTKGMTGYTYNATDNVFSDGVSSELSTVVGTVADGFILTHTIVVAGPTLGVDQLQWQNNQVGQNFPNPVKESTQIPLYLTATTDVMIDLYDLTGKSLGVLFEGELSAGQQSLTFDRSELPTASGYYIYKVHIKTDTGWYIENKKMVIE